MKSTFLLGALVAIGTLAVPARAEDGAPALDRAGLEVGGRYWYSTGRIGYNYYGDTTTSLLVSRLTYDQLTANSGEVYARGDTPWGFFVKGFIGAGSISGGHLTDEDFPPLTIPYSETTSTTSGTLSYGTIDVGYSVIRQPSFRLGGFVGYGRWNESVTASGCTQIATNPAICQPFPLPTSIAVINETDNFNLLRVGATADVMLGNHAKLTVDAAYVHASQKAVDDHFFTFGLDPASGSGNGFQIDAIASYQLSDAWSVGVGGRWWHLSTNTVDSFQQLETYNVDRYGVFLQGSYKFNFTSSN
jgi:outer membrane protease